MSKKIGGIFVTLLFLFTLSLIFPTFYTEASDNTLSEASVIIQFLPYAFIVCAVLVLVYYLLEDYL